MKFTTSVEWIEAKSLESGDVILEAGDIRTPLLGLSKSLGSVTVQTRHRGLRTYSPSEPVPIEPRIQQYQPTEITIGAL